MNKPVAHIVSHTHWDREWYMPYERHHVRLIELMDVLIDTLERDPDYRSFHLDGQTIILDDYLEVRPDMRERLTGLIREGRIAVGPWYVLQDEFLTSAEANVRNLLVGHRDAERYGPVAKIGYFPDSFGNMGQAPQLMRQAGIANAVFGRGVKPTGFNNAVSDSAAYESPLLGDALALPRRLRGARHSVRQLVQQRHGDSRRSRRGSRVLGRQAEGCGTLRLHAAAAVHERLRPPARADLPARRAPHGKRPVSRL
uniref:glycoside hydrolase family 38 N-terminal domain-containing protein n=1 Tax=Cohnella rhizosphaerae TaxID=1457232 RepID=UPI0030B8F50F